MSFRNKDEPPTLRITETHELWSRFETINSDKWIVMKLWNGFIKEEFAVPVYRGIKWLKAFYSLLRIWNFDDGNYYDYIISFSPFSFFPSTPSLSSLCSFTSASTVKVGRTFSHSTNTLRLPVVPPRPIPPGLPSLSPLSHSWNPPTEPSSCPMFCRTLFSFFQG